MMMYVLQLASSTAGSGGGGARGQQLACMARETGHETVVVGSAALISSARSIAATFFVSDNRPF